MLRAGNPLPPKRVTRGTRTTGCRGHDDGCPGRPVAGEDQRDASAVSGRGVEPSRESFGAPVRAGGGLESEAHGRRDLYNPRSKSRGVWAGPKASCCCWSCSRLDLAVFPAVDFTIRHCTLALPPPQISSERRRRAGCLRGLRAVRPAQGSVPARNPVAEMFRNRARQQ